MNPKKLKEKDRRRARKLAEEAWDAVNADNLDLAEKIIRRAVVAQPDNPVLWNDQGMILGLRQKEAESADAYRTAIGLAPTFAEPYDRLADLRIRQGFTAEAVSMQSQAVRHAPENNAYAERLAAYRAMGEGEKPRPAMPPAPVNVSVGDWPERLETYDWQSLGDRLTRDGCVLIERLLDADICAELCGLFDRDELFAKTVVMDRPEFGQGTYRYFRSPLPAVVDQLRRAVYPAIISAAAMCSTSNIFTRSGSVRMTPCDAPTRSTYFALGMPSAMARPRDGGAIGSCSLLATRVGNPASSCNRDVASNARIAFIWSFTTGG